MRPRSFSGLPLSRKPSGVNSAVRKPKGVARRSRAAGALERDLHACRASGVSRSQSAMPESVGKQSVALAPSARRRRGRDLVARRSRRGARSRVPPTGAAAALRISQRTVTDLAAAENVRRLDLDGVDRDRGGDLQPDVAVDAGIGEIVDLAAEGRDLRVLAAVDADGDEVVAGAELAGQPGLEGRVAVVVRRDLDAVDLDRGVGHGAVEDERDLAAGEVRPPGEACLIGEAALVGGLVEVVERQLDGAVRQGDGRRPARGAAIRASSKPS